MFICLFKHLCFWISVHCYFPTLPTLGVLETLGHGRSFYLSCMFVVLGSLSLYALSLLFAYVCTLSYVVMLCISIYSHVVSYISLKDWCCLTDLHCSTIFRCLKIKESHTRMCARVRASLQLWCLMCASARLTEILFIFRASLIFRLVFVHVSCFINHHGYPL